MMKELGFSEYKNASKFLMLPDLFNYFLTGKYTNEYTNNTTSLMYNQVKGDWEEKLLDIVGLDKSYFSEVIQPGTKVGDLKQSICDELEIGSIPVIAPSTHDTASAVAGIPVVDKSKNYGFISMGTWGCVIKETKDPIISNEVMEIGYANEAGVESNLFFKNIAALWLIQQCRDRWVKDHNKDISWDDIVQEAKDKKILKTLIDVDEPVFMLPQNDMPQVICDYAKKNGQPIPSDMGEIARTVYEGIALKARYNVEYLERFTGRKIEKIHMMGGGTKNKLLCQMISDSCRVPVDTGPTETTTVGNLLMQLKADGEIDDLGQGRQISLNSSKIENYLPQDENIWDEAYEIYLEKYKTVNKY